MMPVVLHDDDHLGAYCVMLDASRCRIQVVGKNTILIIDIGNVLLRPCALNDRWS